MEWLKKGVLTMGLAAFIIFSIGLKDRVMAENVKIGSIENRVPKNLEYIVKIKKIVRANFNKACDKKKDTRCQMIYEKDIGGDYWQTPEETKKRKKGDCEDLTWYLSYLLDKSNINNKVVFGYGNIEDIEDKRIFHAWVEYKLNEVTYVLDPATSKIYKRRQLKEIYYVEMKDKDIERKIKRYRQRAYPKR